MKPCKRSLPIFAKTSLQLEASNIERGSHTRTVLYAILLYKSVVSSFRVA